MNRTLLTVPISALIITLFATLLVAEPNVLRGSGGANLNKESTLEREWIVVNDDASPAIISKLSGVKTKAEFKRTGMSYIFFTETPIRIIEPISAIQVKYILFNIWHEPIKVLAAIDIRDFEVGGAIVKGKWVTSIMEGEHFYTSISFISKIRTRSGKILVSDINQVMKVAKSLNKDFSEKDLIPSTDRRRI